MRKGESRLCRDREFTHFLVDFLKIDGMFVKDAVGDPVDFAIVKSTNDMGRGSGQQTIVEFVENEALVKKPQEIGVVYAQGDGIGKATTAGGDGSTGAASTCRRLKPSSRPWVHSPSLLTWLAQICPYRSPPGRPGVRLK